MKRETDDLASSRLEKEKEIKFLAFLNMVMRFYARTSQRSAD